MRKEYCEKSCENSDLPNGLNNVKVVYSLSLDDSVERNSQNLLQNKT